MDLIKRVSWAAVCAVVCMLSAIIFSLNNSDTLGVVLALCGVTWALLSLKDEPTQ